MLVASMCIGITIIKHLAIIQSASICSEITCTVNTKFEKENIDNILLHPKFNLSLI